MGNEVPLFKVLQDLGYSQNKIKLFFGRNDLNNIVKKKTCLTLPIDFFNYGLISPCYRGSDIEILYQDQNFLVLDKPYNVHGHPLLYSEENTCLNFIRSSSDSEFLKIIQVDKNKAERGMLYRLDQETSGVLVFCKDQEMHTHLRSEFQTVVKEKIYGALVHGHCVCDTISSWIYFTGVDNKKAHSVITASQIPQDKKGQKGQIEIVHSTYLEKDNLSFILIKLKEGLRHQIRIQLSMVGHPILGDSLYGAAKASRLFLHAHRYRLETNGISKKFISNTYPLFEKYFMGVKNISYDD